jgi:hypothetical protein
MMVSVLLTISIIGILTSSVLPLSEATTKLAYTWIVILGPLFFWSAACRLDRPQLFPIAAVIALCISLILSANQFYWWVLGDYGAHWLGPFDVTAMRYEGAPRLSGASLDFNRSALGAAVFFYFGAIDPWTSSRTGPALRWVLFGLSAAVAIVSFSRSGILVWLACCLAFVWRLTPRERRIGLCAVAASLLVGWALFSRFVSRVNEVGELRFDTLLGERFSGGAASASTHFDLVEYGLQYVGGHWGQMVFGIGSNASYAILQAFYGGREAGNFHSFYVTGLIEFGIFGFVALLILTLGPLFSSRWLLGLGLAIFGVFYQAHQDPTFWIAVFGMWWLPSGVSSFSSGGDILCAGRAQGNSGRLKRSGFGGVSWRSKWGWSRVVARQA